MPGHLDRKWPAAQILRTTTNCWILSHTGASFMTSGRVPNSVRTDLMFFFSISKRSRNAIALLDLNSFALSWQTGQLAEVAVTHNLGHTVRHLAGKRNPKA